MKHAVACFPLNISKGIYFIYFYLLWQRSMSQFVQNGRQKDVLFVDGLKIGKITNLSSVTGVSIIVDLYPLAVELFCMTYLFYKIYEVLKAVMSIIYVFMFIMQVPNSRPPRMLWCKACSGFYFLGL